MVGRGPGSSLSIPPATQFHPHACSLPEGLEDVGAKEDVGAREEGGGSACAAPGEPSVLGNLTQSSICMPNKCIAATHPGGGELWGSSALGCCWDIGVRVTLVCIFLGRNLPTAH